jgi:hypothetical protein
MTVTARYSLFAFGVSLYRRVYEIADSHDAARNALWTLR